MRSFIMVKRNSGVKRIFVSREKVARMKRRDRHKKKAGKIEELQVRVLRKGALPPCVTTRNKCRGCFGWPAMLTAAQDDAIWRAFPLYCQCTGLTLRIEESDVEACTLV